MKYFVLFFLLTWTATAAFSQQASVSGRINAEGRNLEMASVMLAPTNIATMCDTMGHYSINNIEPGIYTLKASAVGFGAYSKRITLKAGEHLQLDITLNPEATTMNEVVVTGTMKAMSRTESPIPVEVFTPKFFQKNPSPCLFESVGMINGVRPQLNCNVCNTGDIHINGMEGPYTMILIDGMPIVSALSTVYGLSGIPNSIVERVEVVKGPAASLYGSEAMGGIINVITKNPAKAPAVSVDVMGTTWQEYNVDAAVRINTGKAQSLTGINFFNYNQVIDNNNDGFTDLTLQKRISLFNKWSFERKDSRIASIGLRYVNEDRWGGQTNWNKLWRGSDSIYGESVYTNRWELIGAYQLPVKEKIMLQLSYNWHKQDSWYGFTPYNANQQVAFAQLYWDKQIGTAHMLLLGGSYRYTYYDDNTPATADANGTKNQPSRTPLPGIFIQDEWRLGDKHKLLTGYRYDYDKHHGNIHSPRIAYKFSPDINNTFRLSFGTGFRVVNLFTEDHAALTGARQVVIAEELKPERSYNSNLNYALNIPTSGGKIGLDVTAFYSYFTNKIIGDFDTDPNKIIYDNLRGHAISKGVSLNTDISFAFPFKIMAGVTYQDVYQMERNAAGKLQRIVQLHAPKWSGNFALTYTFPQNFMVDLTGQFNGPMRLPVQRNDYRPEYSPWFLIGNIQITKKFARGWELYGGIKNLFNFVPKYALMRPFDPFDKHINDPVNNPNGYTFDTEYNYASLQGIRGFLGVRYNLYK
ncbi:TonB-dependent receptor [Foetidibacter luteolus]|uniref:TonB-dependent receptor n=1 Tax=Foetidibacter luteolus TaxID=2608880 RepID=UPI00129BFB07|nr:TonB-dependent receptor [Foetidibacter luteolus]